jgi:hypothetical protein
MAGNPGVLQEPNPTTAVTVAKGTVTVVAFPLNYWEYQGLQLYFKSKKDNSIDNTGAKKYKQTATVPHDYVVQLQKDLITLNYLPAKDDYRDGYFGPETRRTIMRFQRHAARPYRMPQPDAAEGERLPPGETGICDFATAQEIRKWISKGWRLPLARFPIRAISVQGIVTGGRLREDAAAAWEEIVKLAQSQGATLEGPYGDTTRVLQQMTKSGTSRYSFHYCGRAVDINQELGGGRGQRYFTVKEASGQHTYWRIYCTTAQSSGTHVKTLTKGQVKYYSFFNGKEVDIPAGNYVDLTALIESSGKFERIRAQSGWEKVYNKTEWWHFQYIVDKQATFLDEMELIGYSEDQLRKAGWSDDAMLDHLPG